MPVQTYDIAVAMNAANRLQYFAVGAHSGQIYTCELTNGPQGDWSGGPWSFMGGPTDTLQLAVAKNADGLLELFALKADGRVWHNKQTNASFYDNWGQWTDIGAVDWKVIIIETNADGRLEVFALIDGGQVFHIWQESPSGGWSASAFFNRTGWKDLAVGRNADGRMELFAIGPDNSGYHLAQLAPNGDWSDWSRFGGVDWQQITVISNPDGRLELFVLADGDVSHVWQTAPNNGWNDTELGMMANTSPSIAALPNSQYVGAFQANTGNLWIGGPQGWNDTELGMMANTSPSIAALPNGDHVVAFQANTGNLWIGGPQGWNDTELGMMANTSPSIAALPNSQYVGAFQANTGNLWIGGPQGWSEGRSGFASFGAHDLQFIQIAENADGRLELFALGGDSSIYHIWMTAVNNGWVSQWSNFNVAAQLFEVALDEKGRLVVAYLSADGVVNLLVQAAPNGDWTTPHPAWLSDPEPKPTVTLTANHKEIVQGQTTTLSWTSSWAAALSIDNGIGSVKVPNGSLNVSPQEDTVYTITAASRGGTASDTQMIKVQPAPGLATTRVWLRPQPAEGPVPYVGTMLSVPGGVLKSVTNANSPFKANNGMYLLKVGHGSSECADPNAVIPLAQGQSTSDMMSLFGSADLSNGVRIVACSAGATDLAPMFVDVTYFHP